jgi:hypothetical protein
LSAEATTSNRRDWNWDSDGELAGHYVETRQVMIKNGPSAGQSKLIFDFHVGLEDELVSVWEATVLRSKFREELTRRGAFDFDPGERITITPLGMKEGANGTYRDFAVDFEHAAPKPTTAQLLADTGGDEPGSFTDDDIPFS